VLRLVTITAIIVIVATISAGLLLEQALQFHNAVYLKDLY
jgi:hypothetical protein